VCVCASPIYPNGSFSATDLGSLCVHVFSLKKKLFTCVRETIGQLYNKSKHTPQAQERDTRNTIILLFVKMMLLHFSIASTSVPYNNIICHFIHTHCFKIKKITATMQLIMDLWVVLPSVKIKIKYTSKNHACI
jgi:hypothetical protein